MIRIFNGRGRGLGTAARDEVFLQVTVDLREHLHLFKGARLAVFMAIALHSNEDGWAWPSRKRLAQETGYNEQTVSDAITALCDIEIGGERVLIVAQPRGDKAGTFGNNRYLIFPTAEEIAQLVASGEARAPRRVETPADRPSVENIHTEESPPSVYLPYTVEPYTVEPYTVNPTQRITNTNQNHESKKNQNEDHAPFGVSGAPNVAPAVDLDSLILLSIKRIRAKFELLSLHDLRILKDMEESGPQRKGLLDALDEEIGNRDGTRVKPTGLVVDLRTAIMLLRDETRQIVGGRAEVVAELYRVHFGELAETYPPNLPRLRKMANAVSGGAIYICTLISQTRTDLEADPHDYLHRATLQSPAKKTKEKQGDSHATQYTTRTRTTGNASGAAADTGAGKRRAGRGGPAGATGTDEADGRGPGAERELGSTANGSATGAGWLVPPGTGKRNPYNPNTDNGQWLAWQRENDRIKSEAAERFRRSQAESATAGAE